MLWGDSINSLSVIRPAVAAVLLVVLWVAESALPMFLERKHRIRHGLSNLSLGLLNTLVIALPFAWVMLLITQWTQEHGVGLANVLVNVSAEPIWLRWVLVLILFDGWMYLWHRLNHRLPWLWRFHAVHHSDREMDATSAFRFHTGEIAFSFAARLVVLPILGLSMTQLLLYETIFLPVILFHHSNVRLPAWMDNALRWLIVTPRMHQVHHSRERIETDSNYASVLSVWDRIFGTHRFRQNTETIELGLQDAQGGAPWRSIWQMIKAPILMKQRRDSEDRDPMGKRLDE